MIDPTANLTGEIKLIVTFDPSTGQVNISGPINDKLFCYGLLELAKDAINAHAEQTKKQILVARPAMSLVKQ